MRSVAPDYEHPELHSPMFTLSGRVARCRLHTLPELTTPPLRFRLRRGYGGQVGCQAPKEKGALASRPPPPKSTIRPSPIVNPSFVNRQSINRESRIANRQSLDLVPRKRLLGLHEILHLPFELQLLRRRRRRRRRFVRRVVCNF